MGLRQRDAGLRRDDAGHSWLLPGIVASASVTIAAAGDFGRAWCRYDREAIGDGELWRLLTGHLAHLGPAHLALNIAGLGLVWYLVGAHFRRREWLLIMLAALAGIDLGFWFLEPELRWYVGLSGLLHGVLAAGIVGGWRVARTEAAALAAILVAKLAYEQLAGPLPGSGPAAGGVVIVMAHLYGALAGGLAAAAVRIRVGLRRSI